MINGPDGTGALPRPVNSLTLAQGATSLWGFCTRSDVVDKPGYFRNVIELKKVSGPIVTTLSRHDTAVGKFYPLAAGVALQTNPLIAAAAGAFAGTVARKLAQDTFLAVLTEEIRVASP